MKYSVENDIKYSAKTFDPMLIAYDIESFHPADKAPTDDAPTHRNGGCMAVICASFTKSGQSDVYKAYLLDHYTYDEIAVLKDILERRTALKHVKPNDFRFEVIPCENQTIMACKFLDDV